MMKQQYLYRWYLVFSREINAFYRIIASIDLINTKRVLIHELAELDYASSGYGFEDFF